jgi:hypothetical protein
MSFHILLGVAAMHQQIFTVEDEPDAIAWLFETHLKAYPELRLVTSVVMLTGNEDAPSRVALFAINHCEALIAEFQQDADGNLVRIL